MMRIVYGWSRAQDGDGHWSIPVHVPDACYGNEYPNTWNSDKPYSGRVHYDVDRIETTTTTSLNGTKLFEDITHIDICNECGERSGKVDG